MLNKVIMSGRLTRDVELRYTKNETPVASFSIAVDRNYTKGEDKTTDFFDCVAWQRTAEFVNKYFSKGQLISVEGRLQRRSWVDKNNQTRYAYEIISEQVYFAGAKKNNETAGEPTDFDPFFESAAA